MANTILLMKNGSERTKQISSTTRPRVPAGRDMTHTEYDSSPQDRIFSAQSPAQKAREGRGRSPGGKGSL